MNPRSERGAMLVHVAIALLGLLAFSAIVLDYGVMHSARGQPQTCCQTQREGDARHGSLLVRLTIHVRRGGVLTDSSRFPEVVAARREH